MILSQQGERVEQFPRVSQSLGDTNNGRLL